MTSNRPRRTPYLLRAAAASSQPPNEIFSDQPSTETSSKYRPRPPPRSENTVLTGTPTTSMAQAQAAAQQQIVGSRSKSLKLATRNITERESSLKMKSGRSKMGAQNRQQSESTNPEISIFAISTNDHQQKQSSATTAVSLLDEVLQETEKILSSSNSSNSQPKSIFALTIPAESEISPATKTKPPISSDTVDKSTKVNNQDNNQDEATEQQQPPLLDAAGHRKRANATQKRLKDLCQEAEGYLTIPELPEQAAELIRLAYGKAKLLSGKKFQQFYDLIDKNENPTDLDLDRPTLLGDLEGFWTIVEMQVDNVNQAFDTVRQLAENQWTVIPAEEDENMAKEAKAYRGTPTNSSKSRHVGGSNGHQAAISNNCRRAAPDGTTQKTNNRKQQSIRQLEARKRLMEAKAQAKKKMIEASNSSSSSSSSTTNLKNCPSNNNQDLIFVAY